MANEANTRNLLKFANAGVSQSPQPISISAVSGRKFTIL